MRADFQTFSFQACLLGLTIASLSGCWNSAPPGRVTTSGRVTVAGSPLPDGQITFESVEDGLDRGVSRIDHGGRFSIFLKPGVYRVAIESVEGGVSPAGLDAVELAKLRVAKRYADPRASGLEYTIDASSRRLTIDIPK
jgi:pectin methylesterase-like acyl-CoA thioesterase